jgi:predicted phage tail protein
MPLSEHEQRLLEEMERNLYQNDADFVATVSGRRGKPNYRLIVIGALLAVAGVAGLIAGVIVQQPIIGVVGFGLMLGGVLMVISPGRAPADASSASSTRASAPRKPARSSWMDTMTERWERRQDERGE